MLPVISQAYASGIIESHDAAMREKFLPIAPSGRISFDIVRTLPVFDDAAPWRKSNTHIEGRRRRQLFPSRLSYRHSARVES